MFSVQAVVDAILSVTGGPVSNHPPLVTSDDILAIMDQARDLGNYAVIREMEDQLRTHCDVGYAVATSSGTAAMEVALRLVGVKAGDRVILPTLSFVAAANAVSLLGAIPHFVDAEMDDFGASPEKIKAILSDYGTLPAAIIAVHLLGHPCKIREISVIAGHYGIPLIEDAAEAIGSSADGKLCGGWGDISVLSFNLNKTVTAGGGGAVLTNSEALATQAKRFVTTSRMDHPWLVEHDAVASNHRISMLSGALINSQLKRLNGLFKAKRELAKAYQYAVKRLDGVMFHVEPSDTYSNYWLPTILVPSGERDAVLTALHDRGVMARAVFTPMHRLLMYRDDSGAYPVAEEIFSRAICLPSGIELTQKFR